MPIHNTRAEMKKASISAVITRADGRVEELGVISYYHKNPLINWIVNQWIRMKDSRRKG